jgi:diguanylate cyclase
MNALAALPSTFLDGPYTQLEPLAHELLDLLAAEADMGLWMLTRCQGSDWVPLVVHDRDYGVARGTVLGWSESICSRMVACDGPRVVPDLAQVESYGVAPIARWLGIRSYVGYPIADADGALWGTLCAIDPEPRCLPAEPLQARLRLAARMITTYLCQEQAREAAEQRASRAESVSRTDGLTGALNRRGWEQAVAQEQARIARNASAAGVLVVDLDRLKPINDSLGHEAGDRLLRRCAEVLRETARAADVVARVGGDEFTVLLPDCLRGNVQQAAERNARALRRAGVEASVGWDWSGIGGCLAEAFQRADGAMLARKRRLASRRLLQIAPR